MEQKSNKNLNGKTNSIRESEEKITILAENLDSIEKLHSLNNLKYLEIKSGIEHREDWYEEEKRIYNDVVKILESKQKNGMLNINELYIKFDHQIMKNPSDEHIRPFEEMGKEMRFYC